MSDNTLMEINRKICKSEIVAVRSAIAKLAAAPAKIDFYSVAAASGVSRSTLYRNAVLREMVESARASQPDPWELIHTLREENADLRAQMQSSTNINPHLMGQIIEYTLVGFPSVA